MTCDTCLGEGYEIQQCIDCCGTGCACCNYRGQKNVLCAECKGTKEILSESEDQAFSDEWQRQLFSLPHHTQALILSMPGGYEARALSMKVIMELEERGVAI